MHGKFLETVSTLYSLVVLTYQLVIVVVAVSKLGFEISLLFGECLGMYFSNQCWEMTSSSQFFSPNRIFFNSWNILSSLTLWCFFKERQNPPCKTKSKTARWFVLIAWEFFFCFFPSITNFSFHKLFFKNFVYKHNCQPAYQVGRNLCKFDDFFDEEQNKYKLFHKFLTHSFHKEKNLLWKSGISFLILRCLIIICKKIYVQSQIHYLHFIQRSCVRLL